jgi:hypothetical protein
MKEVKCMWRKIYAHGIREIRELELINREK